MKNYINPGQNLTIPAPYDVISGEAVMSGVLCGVAQADALSGEDVVIATGGNYSLAKTSAQAWTVGAAVYLIPGSRLCTTASSSGNLLIGCASAAAGNPSATGAVRLNSSVPAAVV